MLEARLVELRADFPCRIVKLRATGICYGDEAYIVILAGLECVVSHDARNMSGFRRM